jgi:hypothetical protein
VGYRYVSIQYLYLRADGLFLHHPIDILTRLSTITMRLPLAKLSARVVFLEIKSSSVELSSLSVNMLNVVNPSQLPKSCPVQLGTKRHVRV